MRLEASQSLRLQQKLILAPRMIQSMEILQLGALELQERLQQELEENPVLALRENRQEAAADVDADGATPTAEPANDDYDAEFERFEELSRDWDEHQYQKSRSRGSLEEEGDRKQDAMLNMPARPISLQEHLLEQVDMLDLVPEQEELVRYLITHITDNGYLPPLEPVMANYPVPVAPHELEDAVRQIQKLDPNGVGARTIQECLLLQVTPDLPHNDVLRALIQHHLDDLEHNRLPVIQRKTGFDLEQIREAAEILRHLNPRPGAAFDTGFVPYVVPDVIVERTEDGEYTVRLADEHIPEVFISRRWVERYKDKRSDPKEREYLRSKIQSAQWIVDAIQQRRQTLEKVTKAIIKHQRAFLDLGPEHITPLKMQQVADDVGVHVTTVSRAVDDKWVQTPRGVFALKRFFVGGTTTASGEEVAWEIIKAKMLEIIKNEDKNDPLCDEDLQKKMEEAGYPVARRTITKYRKLLKIPSSRQRKQWAGPA